MMVWPARVISYDSYSLNESNIVRRCPFENVSSRTRLVMLAPSKATVQAAI
jgi:hypothetical protein